MRHLAPAWLATPRTACRPRRYLVLLRFPVRFCVCAILLAAWGGAMPEASAQQHPGTPPTPLGVVLADDDGDFVPDRTGVTVTIGGRAVVASKVLRDDRLDVFIQDGTGGIRLAAPRIGPAIALGDSVVATGTLEHVAGLPHLKTTAYRIIETDKQPPEPLTINLESTFLEHYEGRLGRLKGYVTGKGRVQSGQYIYVAAGDSIVVAFVFSSNDAASSFDDLHISDYVSITGIIGQYDQVAPYNASYQIYPRYADDIRRAGLPPRLYRDLVLGVSGLLLLVLAWVYALRRQLQRRIAQLEASETRYHSLFHNAGDALFVHDLRQGAASPVVEVNKVVCDLLGYTPEALVARTLADLVAPDSRDQLDRLIAVLQADKTALGELVLVTQDHRHIPFEISSHVFAMDGRPTVLSIARDATQRKEYERGLIAAREQAEMLAQLKSAFLANMSHEIRTPLTSIIGFADVLTEDAESVIDLAGHIRNSGQRLMDTLNSILDVSRLDANEVRLAPETIDLVEEVRTTVDLLAPLAEKKNLALRFERQQPTVPAVQDRACLHRIVNNLVSNAIKFTESGAVTVTVSAQGPRFCLTVHDTGIGITTAFLPHLFDEFKQESTGIARSHEGSGLGLAITRRLVDMMGGEISVASEKSNGTTFTVVAPLTAPEAEERLAA